MEGPTKVGNKMQTAQDGFVLELFPRKAYFPHKRLRYIRPAHC